MSAGTVAERTADRATLLGREPVVTVSLVVALLTAILPVFGWDLTTVGVVAGALAVLGGAVSAALVSVDRLLPLLVGVGKAVLGVFAAFGLHLPDNYVAALMAVLAVVAGLQVRNQVVPKQPAVGDGVHLLGYDLDEFEPAPARWSGPTNEDIAAVTGLTTQIGALRSDLAKQRGPRAETHGLVPSEPKHEDSDESQDDPVEHRPRHGPSYGATGGVLSPVDRPDHDSGL